MPKQKYYVVKVGHNPGIYTSWDECQNETRGFPGAKFKKFDTKAQAEHALAHGWDKPQPKVKTAAREITAGFIKNSISVDAACSGNPGQMEYQCVDTDTNVQLFASPIYPVGTNNIGEFLAVVDALKYLQERGLDIPVYTDSISAIAWVRNKRAKTTLVRSAQTESLWQAIDNALDWLHTNSYPNPVLKWETEQWGESKADFGRK